MLEGTIKLHGESESGKTELLRAIERVLGDPQFRHYRITCRTQQPGQPAKVEAIFKREGGAQPMTSTWSKN